MVGALIAGLLSLVGGFWLGAKLSSKVAIPVLKDRDRTQAIDRANYLRVLRRELANILIWRDPQRYISLHNQLTLDSKSLESWRSEEIQKRLAELSVKYPSYDDFDVIDLREYVLYADSVCGTAMMNSKVHTLTSLCLSPCLLKGIPRGRAQQTEVLFVSSAC